MYNTGNSSKNVTTTSIVDGTVSNADIDASAAIATSKLSGAVTGIASHGLASSATTDTTNASNIGSGTLSNSRLSLDISNSDVNASAAIDQSKLATLAITDSEVADNALSGNKIDGGTISGSVTLVTPDIGTPSAGVLTNCSGTASSLTAGNVTTNANLTGVVTSTGNATAIAADAISGDKIDGGTISNFTSTGIDDDASSTAMTLLSTGYVRADNGRVISQMSSCGDVTTSAIEITPIGNTWGGIAFIMGNSGGNMFSDIVSFSLSQIDVLSTQSVSGGPAGRTYTAAGGHLKLEMASGTYACQYSDFTNNTDAS
jgi:hypothetical protein